MWIFAVIPFVLLGEPPLPIDPDALVGCRAPDEPGCERCCRETADGCRVLVGEENWSLYDVEPWYNGVEFHDEACPAACSPCARCSERDEQALMTLAPRPDCDCESVNIGVDPCYHPDSCACHCRNFQSLTSSCPPAEGEV